MIDARGGGRYLETTEEVHPGGKGSQMVVALSAQVAQAAPPPVIRKVSGSIAVRRVVPR